MVGAANYNATLLHDLRRNRSLRKFEVIHLPQKQLAALTNLKNLSGWDKLQGLRDSGSLRKNCSFVALTPGGEVLSSLDFSTTTKAIDALDSALELWEQKKAESEP